MIQLSPNRDRLYSLEEVRRHIAATYGPATKQMRRPIADCLGAILRADVRAQMAVPGHDNSAVDGYAVRQRDLVSDAAVTTLPVIGHAAAGHPLMGSLGWGAVQIFTGAVMPADFDTVVMSEDSTRRGRAVSVPSRIRCGANVRPAGEDVPTGTVALRAGRRLRAADLGMAAALGRRTLAVSAPLRVAIISNGDELIDSDAPRRVGQAYDSNRVMLSALLKQLGAVVTDLGIYRDESKTLAKAFSISSRKHDLILVTGGMSVGQEDHVRQAMTKAGGRIDLWRIAIKPGRPAALGQIKGCAFVGLPGNPVASLVTFITIARPLIDQLCGGDLMRAPLAQVMLGFSLRKKINRQEFVRVRLEHDAKGRPWAHRYPSQGAGMLSSLVASDGFAILPRDAMKVRKGQWVDFLSFDER
ncbi:MAG: gephyrin-like molybdotransferase Glp [Pseudomonadota bacterium]